MQTLEDLKAICRRNGPKDPSKPRQLYWNRERGDSMVSSCNTYRIFKQEDPENPGTFGYGLSLAATGTHAPKFLSGPYFLAKDARDAAQRHSEGLPIQGHIV